MDDDLSSIREAAFRNQFLHVEKAEQLIEHLPGLAALNLSHNRIDSLPRNLPMSLLALDLSFNAFVGSFAATNRLLHLIELKLTHNHLTDCLGLNGFLALEYLDLSNNRISRVNGLETMTRLKLLVLENNAITTPTALRPLSLNKCLTELTLSGNPISASKGYKTTVLGFVDTLKYLDGQMVKPRGASRKKVEVGYAETYRHKTLVGGTEDERGGGGYGASTSHASSRRPTPHYQQGKGAPPPQPPSSSSRGAAGVSLGGSTVHATGDRLYVDGGADDDLLPPRSSLPWRNPPSIVPRDRKGNPLASAAATGAIRAMVAPPSYADSTSSSVRTAPALAAAAAAASRQPRASRPAGASPPARVASPPDDVLRYYAVRHGMQTVKNDKFGVPPPNSHVRYGTHGQVFGSPGRHREPGAGGSPGRGAQWSSPALQRGGTHDILRKLPLSPPRGPPSPPRSRSVLDDSGTDSYYGTGPAHYQPLGGIPSHGYGHGHGHGPPVTEETWEYEGSPAGPGHPDEPPPPFSQTLENRSALLRAIHSAERRRMQQEHEHDEMRRRMPPPPVAVADVDWAHHQSGGRSPPYHRMKNTGNTGRGQPSSRGSHGRPLADPDGLDEEKFEHMLERAREIAAPRDGPPLPPPMHGYGAPDLYTAFADEHRLGGEADAVDGGGVYASEPYGVPASALPQLNRASASPEGRSPRASTTRTQGDTSHHHLHHQHHTDGTDLLAAELRSMEDSMAEFDAVEEMLRGGAGGAGAAAMDGLDDVEKLKAVMATITERRKKSILHQDQH